MISNEIAQQFVTFYLGKQYVGIPVQKVQEVIRTQGVTAAPLAPPYVMGLLNLRGQIVTTIDLGILLGIGKQEETTNSRNIVLDFEGTLFALLVDSVGDVQTLDKKYFSTTPSTLEEPWKSSCAGVYTLPENLLVILEISNLLNFSPSMEAA